MNHKNTRLVAAGLALAGFVMLGSSALAQTGTDAPPQGQPPEAQPRILDDGGVAHHHALHSQNPILARYKGLYPRRTHLTIDDSGAQYTIMNVGPRFEVAEGHYGTANLEIIIETEQIEQVYEAVKDGIAIGMPRIEMAKIVREYTESSIDLPQNQDPNPSGPGPKLDKISKYFKKLMAAKEKGIFHMGKAGEAKAKGKKLATLYHGLLSKLALKKADKMAKKGAGKMLKELGKDLAEGKMELRPGGQWSTFIDITCFYSMVRSAQHFGDVCENLVQRIQGLLVYHKTLPQTGDLATRNQILENRLELAKQLLELIDI